MQNCGIEINYNPEFYYLTVPDNLSGYSGEYLETLKKQNLLKLEIREKNLENNNKTVVEYQCNFDNYNFATVSQSQKLFASTKFQIPLFNKSFWDKTIEAGRIQFPGNVEKEPKEDSKDFPLDWFLVKDDPNFQAGNKNSKFAKQYSKNHFSPNYSV